MIAAAPRVELAIREAVSLAASYRWGRIAAAPAEERDGLIVRSAHVAVGRAEATGVGAWHPRLARIREILAARRATRLAQLGEPRRTLRAATESPYVLPEERRRRR